MNAVILSEFGSTIMSQSWEVLSIADQALSQYMNKRKGGTWVFKSMNAIMMELTDIHHQMITKV